MLEELDSKIRVGRLAWIVENFFKENKRSYHEIGMYYLMELPASSPVLRDSEHTCNDGPVILRFKWFPLTELENLNLRPAFLRKALQQIPEQTEHVIWHDKE
jgi:hypothetical protein